MFSIASGRECFYQWDYNQKLIISDDTVTEVHYCNKTDDCALICEVYTDGGARVADVPNILLQNDWSIRAYAYSADHTKTEQLFKVRKRSKPADYVYTETETLNYNTLLERINKVDENIGAAVRDYLEENPVQAGATAEQAAQIEANKEAVEALQEQAKGYQTEAQVQALIPDTSKFTTMQAVEDKGYQTEAQVKALIPDTSKFTTMQAVEDKGYQTEAQVQALIPDTSKFTTMQAVEDKGYQTEAQVKALIPTYTSETWTFEMEDESTVTKAVLLA